MSDLINNIFKIKKSKAYIDYKNYHKGNIFGITKMSRRELMHSNFIAWALNPQSTHALGYYPIYQFVRSLDIVQSSADNSDARKIDKNLWYSFFDDDFIVDVNVSREVAIPIGKNNKNKFVDLVIEITTKKGILPIIVENKVESDENGTNKDQTKEYFDWFENDNKYLDSSKYFKPLYIYLYPEYNTTRQTQKEYIRMTYQELVDFVIEPSANKCGDIVSSMNYKVYLQCLSFQSDNEKGEYTMAIGQEERKILEDFVRENEDLLCAVIDQLKDLVDVDAEVLKTVTTSIKDKTKYEFENKTYGKGRLVLAVVHKYAEDNKGISFTDLQNAFPDDLQGSKGVVRLSKSVSDEDKGVGAVKRYFVKANEIIKLASGEEVLVSDQWGGADKMDKFIQHVTTKLNYKISKI